MKVFFGYNRSKGQVGVRIVALGVDQIFEGPNLTPPDNIAPWVRDISLALVAAGLIEPAGRMLILRYGKTAFAPLGFTWDESEPSPVAH